MDRNINGLFNVENNEKEKTKDKRQISNEKSKV